MAKKKPMQVTLSTSKYVNEQKVEDKPPKHRPFHEFIEERQQQYKNTPWNIDPVLPNYKPMRMGKTIAKSELPENAGLRRQKYRHVDNITFMDPAVFGKFKGAWERNSSKQRAAFLIGKYEKVDNPAKKGDKLKDIRWPKQILRACVHTIYEPKQIGQPKGVVFQNDDLIQKVMEVAKAMGMEIVGWMITSKERDESVFLSGQEVVQAAMFQNKFKNYGNYSRFVTMVVFPGVKDPQGYMISDQGMLLQEHKLIQKSPDEYAKIRAKKAPKGFYVPEIIHENKGVAQGTDFDSSFLLITIPISASKEASKLFRFVKFPHPREASRVILRAHADQNKAIPYHSALSDFNLLCFLTTLPSLIDLAAVKALATCCKKKERVSQDLQNTLDNMIRKL